MITALDEFGIPSIVIGGQTFFESREVRDLLLLLEVLSNPRDEIALAGLLREALDAWLPRELDAWMKASDEARRVWREQLVPMEQRRPQLLETLNRLYEGKSQVPTPKTPVPTNTKAGVL